MVGWLEDVPQGMVLSPWVFQYGKWHWKDWIKIMPLPQRLWNPEREQAVSLDFSKSRGLWIGNSWFQWSILGWVDNATYAWWKRRSTMFFFDQGSCITIVSKYEYLSGCVKFNCILNFKKGGCLIKYFLHDNCAFEHCQNSVYIRGEPVYFVRSLLCSK